MKKINHEVTYVIQHMSLETSVFFDKLISISHYENKPIVYDWKADFLNNKIIFEKNINETNNFENLFKILKHHYNQNYCEEEDCIYIISNETYKVIYRFHNPCSGKTHIHYIINNVPEQHNEIYKSYNLNITVNENLLTIADLKYEKTSVYNIDQKQYIHFDEYLPKFKKINDDIIYSCHFRTLVLYYLTTKQMEIIYLSEYGSIANSKNLKNKIFMSFFHKKPNSNCNTYLVIYDINKKIFQVDYSELHYAKFIKYNNVLMLYKDMCDYHIERIIDSNDHKFLFLTPDIKFETCDIFFRFE